jgi:transcriptional antiterminator RfaH
MADWYVVHTAPNGEARAAAHLKRQDFETFLPVYTKTRRHARRAERVLAPLFPRYLFVRLDLAADRWRSVNGTIGVSHIICDDSKPLPVRDGVVELLMNQADTRGCMEPAALQVLQAGDRLRVVEGAMMDHTGIFERLTPDQRVVLLMSVLGRDVKVTVPIASVDAA